MNANKPVTPTTWTDPDDAPELDDAFFERAEEYVGKQLLRSGQLGTKQKQRDTA